jgi:Secretion system C-terminal sorting domain
MPYFILLAGLFLCSFIASAQLRLKQDFTTASGSTAPAGWKVELIEGVSNMDGWRFDDPYLVSPLASASSGIFATFPGYFISDNGKPEESSITTPVFNCSDDNQVALFFYEYYFINPTAESRIEVSISNDNGITWNVIYEKSEGESPGIPVLQKIDISGYAAQRQYVKVKFRARGNNSLVWMLDDIQVTAGAIDPPVIMHVPLASTCSASPLEIVAEIQSPSGVSSANVVYRMRNGPLNTMRMNLETGNKYKAILPLSGEWGSLQYNIQAIDGSVNLNTSYDTKTSNRFNRLWYGNIFSGNFKEDFSPSLEPAYFISVYPDSLNWSVTEVISLSGENGPALTLNFYEEEFEKHHASFQLAPISIHPDYYVLTFDVAYAFYEKNYDTLKINVSADGGRIWNNVYKKSGGQLSTAGSSLPPFYPKASQWGFDYVSLEEYANRCVLIAFEGISDNGNNLFVDNLTFKKLDDSGLYLSQNYPNPVREGSTKIDAEVPLLRSSIFFLYDSSGKMLLSQRIEPHLGRFTLEVETTGLSNGIYLYRIGTNEKSVSKKMLVIN